MEQALNQNDIRYFFQEIKDLYKETDRKFKETERLIDKRSKETERLMDKRSEETNHAISRVNKVIGQLGGRLGDFVEEMVKPGVVRLFQERGIKVHEVHRDVTAHRNKDSLEIDLLVVNDTDIVAIECKSKLSIDDVNEHIKRLGKVKKLLPKYSDMNIMGAVAAMVIPENVARYSYRKGLFVIAQSGEIMKICNDLKFIPGVW